MTIASQSRPAPAGRARRMTIDVWSDIGCPWCYIGKRRLELAIEKSGHAEGIDVVAHSFELAPDIGPEPTPVTEYVAHKMNMSVAQAVALENKVAAIAHSLGLEYTADRIQANTFDAHRLLHLAAENDRGQHLLTTLQRELFSGRANVYAHDFLLAAAVEVGLDGQRVREVLATDAYADDVRADRERARELGVTGVPFVIIDERFAIPGAPGIDGYVGAIERAWGAAEHE